MTIQTEIKIEKLTKDDRCDGCGAQAYVWVKGVSGELMFCGHHFTKIMGSPDSATAMNAFAFEVVDQRGEEV
jgi:hypothetical protein